MFIVAVIAKYSISVDEFFQNVIEQRPQEIQH